MDNQDRILGQLEAGMKALSENVNRILEGQEKINRDNDEAKRRIHERIERHEVENNVTFKAINEGLVRLSEHMARMEAMSDSVEGNAEAIHDHEQRLHLLESKNLDIRLTAREQADIREMIKLQQNRRWMKMLLGAGVAIEGDHIAGWRLVKWIGSIFVGK